jgi:hypothetical protein
MSNAPTRPKKPTKLGPPQRPQKRFPQRPDSGAAAKEILRMCDAARMPFVASAFIERDLPLARAREELAELRRCDRILASASPLIREGREVLLTVAARDARDELMGHLLAARREELDEELDISSHLPVDGSVGVKLTDSRKIFARRRKNG